MKKAAPKASGPGKQPVHDLAETEAGILARRHLLLGWWFMLAFLTLGIVLETLHGFKSGWYLSVANANRRLLLTLAHAHGALLGLAQIGFAFALANLTTWEPANRRLAANCLLGAGVLIPCGFLLGGLNIYAGDPGVGLVMVPAGALLLMMAAWFTARAARSRQTQPPAFPAP